VPVRQQQRASVLSGLVWSEVRVSWCGRDMISGRVTVLRCHALTCSQRVRWKCRNGKWWIKYWVDIPVNEYNPQPMEPLSVWYATVKHGHVLGVLRAARSRPRTCTTTLLSHTEYVYSVVERSEIKRNVMKTICVRQSSFKITASSIRQQ